MLGDYSSAIAISYFFFCENLQVTFEFVYKRKSLFNKEERTETYYFITVFFGLCLGFFGLNVINREIRLFAISVHTSVFKERNIVHML